MRHFSRPGKYRYAFRQVRAQSLVCVPGIQGAPRHTYTRTHIHAYTRWRYSNCRAFRICFVSQSRHLLPSSRFAEIAKRNAQSGWLPIVADKGRPPRDICKHYRGTCEVLSDRNFPAQRPSIGQQHSLFLVRTNCIAQKQRGLWAAGLFRRVYDGILQVQAPRNKPSDPWRRDNPMPPLVIGKLVIGKSGAAPSRSSASEGGLPAAAIFPGESQSLKPATCLN
jgi:hypothetical protein